MRAKEWLYANGHIEKEDVKKRGRPTAAHRDLIMAALAEDSSLVIDGYSVERAPATATAKPDAPKVTRESAGAKEIADVREATRPIANFEAFAVIDGERKPLGDPKRVCHNCGSSLPYCGCRVPVVFFDHNTLVMVEFAPKG